jgi:hypothetical protein
MNWLKYAIQPLLTILAVIAKMWQEKFSRRYKRKRGALGRANKAIDEGDKYTLLDAADDMREK